MDNEICNIIQSMSECNIFRGWQMVLVYTQKKKKIPTKVVSAWLSNTEKSWQFQLWVFDKEK